MTNLTLDLSDNYLCFFHKIDQTLWNELVKVRGKVRLVPDFVDIVKNFGHFLQSIKTDLLVYFRGIS